MSKLKFGIGALQAFQENYQELLDRLIKGYRKMTNKEPEGLDLIKIKQEARQRAEEASKVVDMEGRTLDPSKPIMGGTQQIDEGGIPTTIEGKTKTMSVDEIMDFVQGKKGKESIMKADDAPKPEKTKTKEMFEEFEERTNVKSGKIDYDKMEDKLGVELFGDETFDELLEIERTGKHPRMKADGGLLGEVRNIIGAGLEKGSDLASGAGKFILGAASGIPGAGLLLAGLGKLGQPTISNLAQQNFLDVSGAEVDDLGRLTSGIMQGYNTRFDLSPRARARISAIEKLGLTPERRTKIDQLNEFIQQQEAAQAAAAAAAADSKRAREAFLSISQGEGGYSGSSGPTSAGAGMGVGGGYASDYGFLKDGGLAGMFTEKR